MLKKTKVFRDPVHGLITFDQDQEVVLLELIQAPEFQRLRRIRQLGLTWAAFHGAEHSRFSHSLGVCHLTGYYMDRLFELYRGEIAGNDDDFIKKKTLVRCAGLLHDTGHAPFSHVFEHATEKITQGKGFSHETLTKQIITDTSSTINQILKKYEIEPDDVYKIINQTHEDTVLVNIVTSQFDADRMDYLQRDSLFTGVKYGLVDQDWLIHSLRQGTPENDQRVIAVDASKGKNSIVNFVLARKNLFQQVYFHHKVRAAEVQLTNILKRMGDLAIKGEDLGVDEYLINSIISINGKYDPQNILKLDDFVLLNTIREIALYDADKTIQKLCTKFTNNEIFKNEQIRITDRSFFLSEEMNKLFSIDDGDFDPDGFFGIDEAKKTFYENTYTRGERKEEETGDKKEARNEIWVMDASENLMEISTASEEIRGIMQSPENKAGNFSLCFDDEFYDRNKVRDLVQ